MLSAVDEGKYHLLSQSHIFVFNHFIFRAIFRHWQCDEGFKTKEMYDNTLFVFTSDNGGQQLQTIIWSSKLALEGREAFNMGGGTRAIAVNAGSQSKF